jgi:hypothetical protein
MKKSDWMTEAGHQSGERAERLQQQRLRARSPMEVFADEFIWVFVAVLLFGGALGAIFAADTVRPAVESVIGVASEPYTMKWFIGWLIERAVASVVGLLVAFLVIDIPLTFVVMWLRRNRPDLFRPRG